MEAVLAHTHGRGRGAGSGASIAFDVLTNRGMRLGDRVAGERLDVRAAGRKRGPRIAGASGEIAAQVRVQRVPEQSATGVGGRIEDPVSLADRVCIQRRYSSSPS